MSGDDLICLSREHLGSRELSLGAETQCSVGFTEDLLCTYRIVTGSRDPAVEADTSLTPGRNR